MDADDLLPAFNQTISGIKRNCSIALEKATIFWLSWSGPTRNMAAGGELTFGLRLAMVPTTRAVMWKEQQTLSEEG